MAVNLQSGWKRNLDVTLSQIIAQQVNEFQHVQLADQQATEHCIVMNLATFTEARKRLWKNKPIPDDRRYRGALVVVLEFLEEIADNDGDGETPGFSVGRRKPLEDGQIFVIKFSDPRLNDALRQPAPAIEPGPRLTEFCVTFAGNGPDEIQAALFEDGQRGETLALAPHNKTDSVFQVGDSIIRMVYVESSGWQPQIIASGASHTVEVVPVAKKQGEFGVAVTYSDYEPLDLITLDRAPSVDTKEH